MSKSWLSCASAAISVLVVAVPAHAESDLITDPDMACNLAYARDGAWAKPPFLRKCLTLENDNKVLAILNTTLMSQAEAITKQLKGMEKRYVAMESSVEAWEKKAKLLAAMNRDLEVDRSKHRQRTMTVAVIGFSVGVLVTTITAVAINNMELGL